MISSTTEAFEMLAAKGDLAALQGMIHEVDPLANQSGALVQAAAHGHLDVVNWLIPRSWTAASDALEWAATEGHEEVMKALLPHYTEQKHLISLIRRLAPMGKEKEIVLICEKKPSELYAEAWEIASSEGQVNLLETLFALPKARHLVQRDVTLFSQSLGKTASGGHQKALLFWLDERWQWEPHAEDEAASNALRLAAQNGHTPIVKWLLAHTSAQADSMDSWALRSAARNGHETIVDLLLRKSNPQAVNSQALIRAIECNHTEIALKLLPHSDPKAQDQRPLHAALENDNRNLIQALLPLSDVERIANGLFMKQQWKHLDVLASHLAPETQVAWLEKASVAALPRTQARHREHLLEQQSPAASPQPSPRKMRARS